ncbi:MAG: DUF5317 family protein [Acidimicrobiales bacterium]
MTLVALALVAGIAAGLLAGGRPRNLGRLTLRWSALLLLGATSEVAGTYGLTGTWATVTAIFGYVLLLGFAARNLRLTGMVLVLAGLLANFTITLLDGGMPVRGEPAGVALGARHHGEQPSDRLVALGDVVPVGFLGETVSAGDIVLALGVAAAVAALLRSDGERTATARGHSAAL